MQHGDFLVEIFDENGNKTGAKPRRDVDKVRDVVHCADVMLVQHGALVLARIPTTTLYGGRLTATTGTMVREGEAPDAAVRRALEKELGVVAAPLVHLSHDFFIYPDGVRRMKTTFSCVYDGNLHANPEDIAELVPMKRHELEVAIAKTSDAFAPTFLAVWGKYAGRLQF